MESLLSDLQGAKMSPRRKALYSLIFFLLLVIFYWACLCLIESFLAVRDSLTGHMERMSAAQSLQMSEVARRLEVLEGLVTRMHSQNVDNKLETILTTVKEGAEGNTSVNQIFKIIFKYYFFCSLKMTVMDRLVAELGGIETAIVTLQEQV